MHKYKKYANKTLHKKKSCYNKKHTQNACRCDWRKYMIKVGIIGATGYAGNEIVRLLLGHKDVKIVWFGREVISTRSMQMYTEICFSL